MEKNKRNKIIGLSLGILIVLIIVVSSTYAYWQVTRTQETPNDIVAACLNLDLNDASAENKGIDLDSAWPISDEEAKELTGYTFTVTNNCDEEINYIVGLNRVEESNYLQDSSIKLQLDDNSTFLYSDLSDVEYADAENTEYIARSSKQVSVETIGANGTNTHTIRIWVSDEAPVTEQSKTFLGQVFITGGQGINKEPSIEEDSSDMELGSCFEITDNGVILGYDESCGLDVVVPAEVNGIQVKEINNASFSQGTTIAFIEANYKNDETGETLTDMLIYFKSNEQRAAQETALKNQICGGQDCNLADMGAIILDSSESVKAIDWSKYTDMYTVALGYAGSTNGLHDAGNPGNITSLDLSKAIYLEEIEDLSFYGGYSYTSEVNNNCIYNSEESMYACSWGLQSLKLPQNGILTTIGDYAFEGNPNNETDKNFFFEELNIPSTVEKIGREAFANRQISSLIFEDTEDVPSQLSTIGNMAFESNNLTKIVIPGSVTSIGSSAFTDNANLIEVIIKNTEGNVTLSGAFPSSTTITYNPNYTE